MSIEQKRQKTIKRERTTESESDSEAQRNGKSQRRQRLYYLFFKCEVKSCFRPMLTFDLVIEFVDLFLLCKYKLM